MAVLALGTVYLADVRRIEKLRFSDLKRAQTVESTFMAQERRQCLVSEAVAKTLGSCLILVSGNFITSRNLEPFG